MARPFRFQPPSPLPGAVPRPAVQRQLALRHARRLVAVVAGPGFGKTTALAAAVAMADTAADGGPAASDAWLTCEPADATGEHLLAGIAEALDLDATASVDGVCERVWSQAPSPVCLVLDDVHEIGPRSSGADLLRRLLTELPANGHLTIASRERVPVPTARLAAASQLVQVTEADLLLEPEDLQRLAAAHGTDPAILDSTGGWPALAELTATARTDLAIDYLWEEVLADLGEERAGLLARLALVGGGDDAIATALAGHPAHIDDVVAGVPLVTRNTEGWAALHPLWRPALRALVPAADEATFLRAAAQCHREHGRPDLAVDLLSEAEAWDEVLDVFRAVLMEPEPIVSPQQLKRWCQILPRSLRSTPEAQLLAGVVAHSSDPIGAADVLAGAASGFRARSDDDGELAAIAREGSIRWWAGDFAGLFALHARVVELAAAGIPAAAAVSAVAQAGVAHLVGDSAAVLAHLDGIDAALPPSWHYQVHWLRSVAHRRDGDLRQAHQELLAAADHAAVGDPQLEMAQLRIDWLAGEVDDVVARLTAVADHYASADPNQFLAHEATLELAAKTAFLGDAETARTILASIDPDDRMPALRMLQAIAGAAVAVAGGDEDGAASALADAAATSLSGPDRWYWRDRLAIALTHVLVPATRTEWAKDQMGRPHRPGLALAEALEAVRCGDLTPVAILEWPPVGMVRAHLPVPWAAELAAAGTAAGNPPPAELVPALGSAAAGALRTLATTTPAKKVATAATRLASALPPTPPYRLRLGVLGSLEVHRDGEVVSHPDLRRQRVRELVCHLVATRKARREAVADELWPDLLDAGRNLRVTLSYVQHAFQPDRPAKEPPFFLRAEGAWLLLTADPHLSVDAWELDEHLERAAAAEAAGATAEALDAYLLALPLWRGEAYADAGALSWVYAERARLTGRYVAAAVRAGELLLAARRHDDAAAAARHAVFAEPTTEPAYRLLARTHLAAGDRAGARAALDACRSALAELGVEPEPATLDLLPT